MEQLKYILFKCERTHEFQLTLRQLKIITCKIPHCLSETNKLKKLLLIVLYQISNTWLFVKFYGAMVHGPSDDTYLCLI